MKTQKMSIIMLLASLFFVTASFSQPKQNGIVKTSNVNSPGSFNPSLGEQELLHTGSDSPYLRQFVSEKILVEDLAGGSWLWISGSGIDTNTDESNIIAYLVGRDGCDTFLAFGKKQLAVKSQACAPTEDNLRATSKDLAGYNYSLENSKIVELKTPAETADCSLIKNNDSGSLLVCLFNEDGYKNAFTYKKRQ